MQPSISERIAEALDPSDATPLYHQLAAVVRWEVGHGRLPLGTTLPPVREVAALAGINYHTVRRAWGELEAEGVISQRRGRGARVIRAPHRTGWSPAGTIGLASAAIPRIWVVAPALTSAAVLAESIGRRWMVEATPWPLTASAPPPGRIVSTAATSGAATSQWPTREGDLRSLATTLPQSTIAVLRRNAALLGVKRVRISGSQGEDGARDLLRQLPRLGLQVELAPDDQLGTEAEATSDALVLYFPGAWSALDWGRRMHPSAVLVEPEWAAGPLAGVAREQGWVQR